LLKGTPVTDLEQLSDPHISFHASGFVNATERSFRLPLRGITVRHQLAVVNLQHPSKYPVRQTSRVRDVVLDIPTIPDRPMYADLSVAPAGFEVEVPDAHVQALARFDITDLHNVQPFSAWFGIGIGFNGEWPRGTVTIWGVTA
jgi:hypothetical protein